MVFSFLEIQKNSYKSKFTLRFFTLPKSDILIFELRVTSYELFLLHELQVTFCIRVTSYCFLHELRVTFYIRVASYCLLHELRVTFIARVTSYCLLHELRVTVCYTSYQLLFAYELRVNLYM